ncbi:hypothetical protein E5676_scaffold120G001800 [Cucumis melo var. makuwa]|uniref:Uncharacterized protein n=1 Tax=Cucumis melo var. makuwa TaxID=1194695 RepID=A0A5D3DZX2_CUCMM|nr:hypothetical protein E6C27_scaffold186G002390 [Cucumis melo var. makuwa]TYK29061.1 hypothetical protein E5676_scaffold120G001800 [Cucumis melo var. makuwa]
MWKMTKTRLAAREGGGGSDAKNNSVEADERLVRRPQPRRAVAFAADFKSKHSGASRNLKPKPHLQVVADSPKPSRRPKPNHPRHPSRPTAEPFAAACHRVKLRPAVSPSSSGRRSSAERLQLPKPEPVFRPSPEPEAKPAFRPLTEPEPIPSLQAEPVLARLAELIRLPLSRQSAPVPFHLLCIPLRNVVDQFTWSVGFLQQGQALQPRSWDLRRLGKRVVTVRTRRANLQVEAEVGAKTSWRAIRSDRGEP